MDEYESPFEADLTEVSDYVLKLQHQLKELMFS